MVVICHSAFYVGPGFEGKGSEAALRNLRWVTDHMGTGVLLFFVISGYCIAAACDGVRRKPKSASQFFLRRFRRIFPPYWVTLLGYVLVLSGLSAIGLAWVFHDPTFPPIPQPRSLGAWQWLGGVTLTEQWRDHLLGGPDLWLLGQAWSLCYEEQFYAVCGLALFVSRKWFFRLLALLTLAVGALAAFEVCWRHLPMLEGFFFDGRWLDFAPGVLLYYRLHHATGRVQWRLDTAMCIAPVVLGFVAWWRPHHYIQECFLSWTFAALLRFLYRWDVAMVQSRWLRPGCFCGLMCYSLYLTHFPLSKACSHMLYLGGVRGLWPTLLVTIPLCLALCISLAWAFHVYVERRFLNTPAVMAHLLVAADQRKRAKMEGAEVAAVGSGVSTTTNG
jgi:peptidoglycan/LPS O-acetylase OafA/YrhL